LRSSALVLFGVTPNKKIRNQGCQTIGKGAGKELGQWKLIKNKKSLPICWFLFSNNVDL